MISDAPDLRKLLDDGDYPFIDRLWPLSEMSLQPMPASLEQLIMTEAGRQGVQFQPDAFTQLNLASEEFPTASFMVLRESGSGQLVVLAPKKFSKGGFPSSTVN